MNSVLSSSRTNFRKELFGCCPVTPIQPVSPNNKVTMFVPAGRHFIGIIYSKMRKIGFMYLAPGHFIPYRSSQLHYYVWGSGPVILFAFHGYGESAPTFAFIGAALGPGFTLVAIDLPFHGRTDWKEGRLLAPGQLYKLMQEIVGRLPPAPPDARLAPGTSSRWGLIGYSMGGRIALQLVENHPEQFTRLILLAPDGLKVNFWYWIATQTTLGNLLFRLTMRRPGWLVLFLRISHALRLANPGIFKFAVHHIDDRRVRQDLYARWTAMRKFKPHLATIASIIRRQQLPVTLVYGKYDRVIRWERAEKFRERGIADLCRLILLDTGHQLLQPQFLPDILPLITA
jgi:pimeloyl-ACP methyl ester carboxylesterase